MAVSYYKRFRMEIDLGGRWLPHALSEPYTWVPWADAVLDAHAEVIFHCFHRTVDAEVFPCLGDRWGCRRLMREIRRRPGFLSEATWLIAGPEGYIGSVQGVIDRGALGSIQNVGVVADYRGLGLGRALVRQSLSGFVRVGIRRATLEVTAENSGAVMLYRSLGFRKAKTLFRAVDR